VAETCNSDEILLIIRLSIVGMIYPQAIFRLTGAAPVAPIRQLQTLGVSRPGKRAQLHADVRWSLYVLCSPGCHTEPIE
jgi:hypothetical protein